MSREDYKRRWLERQQQQQEEEEPRDVYAIEHHTYFSKKYGYYYNAVVEVYDKRSIVELYKTTPKIKLHAPFWIKVLAKFLETPSNEPICNPISISNNDLVHHVIKGMVVEYEMPLYTKWMAEELQGDLYIDYEEELRKKRQRLTNIDRELVRETKVYEPPTISGLVGDTEPTEEEKKEQRIQEIAREKGVDPASLRNLLPFQTKKSG